MENKLEEGPQDHFFPSPIVMIEVENRGDSYTVRIPKKELFRLKAIFQHNEYSIVGPRSHSGPLTVIDIGANVGLYAIYMKFNDPHSVIHCFEPSPSSLALLEENVGDIPGINLHPYGLYNGGQEADMNIHRFNTGQNSIKLKNENYTNTVSVRLKDAGNEFDKLGVDHLDVFKIDTEGCEVEILESLGYRLGWIDYTLVEYHSEKDRRQIDHLLKEFHVLGSKSEMLGSGIVKYINTRLLTALKVTC